MFPFGRSKEQELLLDQLCAAVCESGTADAAAPFCYFTSDADEMQDDDDDGIGDDDDGDEEMMPYLMGTEITYHRALCPAQVQLQKPQLGGNRQPQPQQQQHQSGTNRSLISYAHDQVEQEVLAAVPRKQPNPFGAVSWLPLPLNLRASTTASPSASDRLQSMGGVLQQPGEEDVSTPDASSSDWNETDVALFNYGRLMHGDDLRLIRRDVLPHKSMAEIIDHYFREFPSVVDSPVRVKG